MEKQLVHLLGIGPLFLYIGLYKDQVPDWMFHMVGLLGLGVLGFHSYLAIGKLKEHKSAWIHWIHICLVAPLLLILAYLKQDAHRRYFEMMLMIGCAAIGYHGIYLIREIMLR